MRRCRRHSERSAPEATQTSTKASSSPLAPYPLVASSVCNQALALKTRLRLRVILRARVRPHERASMADDSDFEMDGSGSDGGGQSPDDQESADDYEHVVRCVMDDAFRAPPVANSPRAVYQDFMRRSVRPRKSVQRFVPPTAGRGKSDASDDDQPTRRRRRRRFVMSSDDDESSADGAVDSDEQSFNDPSDESDASSASDASFRGSADSKNVPRYGRCPRGCHTRTLSPASRSLLNRRASTRRPRKQVSYAESSNDEDAAEVELHEADRRAREANTLTVEEIVDHRTVLRPPVHRSHEGGVRGMRSSGRCECCAAAGLQADGRRYTEDGAAAATEAGLVAMTEFLVKWRQGSHLWDTWECNAVLRGTTYRGRNLRVRRCPAPGMWPCACLLTQLRWPHRVHTNSATTSTASLESVSTGHRRVSRRGRPRGPCRQRKRTCGWIGGWLRAPRRMSRRLTRASVHSCVGGVPG